jgi:hypothetical protein
LRAWLMSTTRFTIIGLAEAFGVPPDADAVPAQ